MTPVLPRLDIQLLGTFGVRLDGGLVTGFRSQQARWLLAILALQQGNEVEYRWLADTLEETDDNLRQIVKRLLSTLDAARDCFPKPTKSSMRLDLTTATVDVLTFDAACVRGGISGPTNDRTPEGFTRTQISALREAVDRYRGDILPECALPWIERERTQRRLKYQEALKTLIEEAQSSGDHENAASYLKLRIASEPYEERGREQLMRLSLRRGDIHAAREVYHDYRRLLMGKGLAEPGKTLQELYESTRTSGSDRRQRPSLSPSPARYRLPDPPALLLGRERATDEILAALDFKPLVTLKGSPGVGKTALARQVAAQALPNYPDGVAFVDLTNLQTAAQLQREIVSALNLEHSPNEAHEGRRLQEFLASRRLLLILDNCEHLVGVCAAFVKRLLAESSFLRILATSRRAWSSISSERVISVSPLALPPPSLLARGPDELAAKLPRFAAVQLYLQEVANVQPAITLTPQNAHAVASLCRHLDGLPLALKLAAGATRVRTPAQTLTALEQGLGVLRDRSGALSARHSTLQAALDLSYHLLSPDLQAVLRGLTVFRGGAMLEAIEAVIGGADVDEALSQLQERSLVVAEEVHEALRFRLLETVRQYSLERLNASSEADAMRARHLTYYRQFVETLASKQVGGAPGNALDRLERERENLQAALSHAVEARETESGLRVASILWRFWLLRGYVGEGREQMNLLLAQDTDVPASVRAEALNGAGVLAQSQSDYTAARTLHEESLRLYQDAGEQQGMANVLSNLAMLAYNQRGYPEAAKRFRDCLQLHRELGNRRGIASSLLNLGNIALRRHDYTAARALYEESLAVPRYPGDGQNVAIALLNLGSVYLLLEDHPAARTRLQECLKGCRDLQYREGIASALEAFASLAAAEGEGARAGRLAGAADALRGEFNLPRSPDEAAELTEALSPARQMLDEAAFAAALAEGGRMPWEQAVEYALAPTSFVAEQDNPRG